MSLRSLLARRCWLLAAVLAAMAGTCASSQADEPVSFRAQVAPILVKQCLGCHGDQEPKGDFQLQNFENLMADGYVEAGEPDGSHLLGLLSTDDADTRMPKDADPLPGEQVALIKQWIAQGAKYDAEDVKATLVSIIPKLPHPDPPEAYRVAVPITALAIRPDGGQLAVNGYREITLWNMADGTLERRIKNVAQRTFALAYSPDGTLLAAASGIPGQLGEVRLFNPADGSLVRELVTIADTALDVTFSPDGTKLAACGADRAIRIFDVASGTEEVLIEDHADWVMAIAFNHDGTRLVSASRDKTAKVFDAKTGDAQNTYPGHGEPVFGCAFNSDGTQVFTAGADNKIHVWNPADGKKIADIGGFGHHVLDVAFQEGQVFSASADKQARQHAAADRSQVRAFTGHEDWIYSIAPHVASMRFVTGSYDGEVRIWNLEDGALLKAFKAAPGLPAADSQQAAAK